MRMQACSPCTAAHLISCAQTAHECAASSGLHCSHCREADGSRAGAVCGAGSSDLPWCNVEHRATAADGCTRAARMCCMWLGRMAARCRRQQQSKAQAEAQQPHQEMSWHSRSRGRRWMLRLVLQCWLYLQRWPAPAESL